MARKKGSGGAKAAAAVGVVAAGGFGLYWYLYRMPRATMQPGEVQSAEPDRLHIIVLRNFTPNTEVTVRVIHPINEPEPFPEVIPIDANGMAEFDMPGWAWLLLRVSYAERLEMPSVEQLTRIDVAFESAAVQGQRAILRVRFRD